MNHEKQKVSDIVISLGSNCGNRQKNVREAIEWLSEKLSDCRFSSIYETPEIHGKGKPYMNAVVNASTGQNMESMQSLTKKYEIEHGRNSECRAKGEVPIDIDIVKWDSEILRPLDFSREFFKIGYRELFPNA